MKYLGYIKFFSKKLIKKLPKYFDINIYSINLELDKKLLYKLIYKFKLVKLKFFKLYIDINLVKKIFQLIKLIIAAFILFVSKLINSFYLYINY